MWSGDGPHSFIVPSNGYFSLISRVIEDGSYLAYVYLIQVVGWPLLPNGLPGERCREVKSLIQHAYLYGMVSHRKISICEFVHYFVFSK